MMQEESMEGLFAQFDQVAEKGPGPSVAVSATNLTHSRAPSLATRLVRWILQGSGLMVLYLTVFFLIVGRPQEILLESIGLIIIAMLVAPLMGARPLAHPGRWALLLMLVSVLAAVDTAIARWPFFLAQSTGAPVSAMVLAACEVAERATAPLTVLGCITAGFVLMWLGRMLAKANPWLETRARWKSWRRVLGLSSVGLIAGIAVALPLLHRITWSQDWLLENKAHLPTAVPQAYSSPGDLSSIFLGQPATGKVDASTTIDKLTRIELVKKMSSAADYLESNKPLTVTDLPFIKQLMMRGELEQQDSEIDRFLWAAYVRAFHKQLDFQAGTIATRVLRQTLLHRLAGSPENSEELAMWEKRGDSLLVLKPVSQRGADALFLERLGTYRPGFPSPLLTRPEFHRPLRLFGIETPWTPAALSLDAERTLAVLVFSHRRNDLAPKNTGYERLLLPPFTHIDLFDATLYDLFTAVTDEQPYHYAADDEALFWTVLQLKKKKLKSGRFPATYNTSDKLEYHSDGGTARLTFKDVPDTSHLHFDETLR